MTLEHFCALVIRARRGDVNVTARLLLGFQQVLASSEQDPVLRRFFAILIDILAGSDTLDLSDLPPE
ncbi:MAG: hypothetical protein M9936_32310 [Caldilinea sp.]|nr:hypothetical protein [Caldilinea sp.]MCB0148378.1 hypothetical protein [Caldilineaceae bacterium]MCB9140765.1 hypothetical protein [Anaerolineales bacterium]MCB0052873.1 hypothetical protein [Caldilinea sp.]MCO5214409.1 hypothetical protein [Caldilinea sp.]